MPVRGRCSEVSASVTRIRRNGTGGGSGNRRVVVLDSGDEVGDQGAAVSTGRHAAKLAGKAIEATEIIDLLSDDEASQHVSSSSASSSGARRGSSSTMVSSASSSSSSSSKASSSSSSSSALNPALLTKAFLGAPAEGPNDSGHTSPESGSSAKYDSDSDILGKLFGDSRQGDNNGISSTSVSSLSIGAGVVGGARRLQKASASSPATSHGTLLARSSNTSTVRVARSSLPGRTPNEQRQNLSSRLRTIIDRS
jgi:hypothetical protein